MSSTPQEEYQKRSNYKKMNDSTRVVLNKVALINRSLDLLRKNDREEMGLDQKAELSNIVEKVHEIQDSLAVIIVSAIEEQWRCEL